jgi:hypothetical protein
MNPTRKLLAIGATVVAFGGVGAIAAVAQTSTTTKPAPVTSTPSTPSADPDKLQQGDQTTPDVPGATETPDPAEKSTAATSAVPAEKSATPESETANDGPGGHSDAPGAVDHQFNGQE